MRNCERRSIGRSDDQRHERAIFAKLGKKPPEQVWWEDLKENGAIVASSSGAYGCDLGFKFFELALNHCNFFGIEEGQVV